MTRPCAAPPSSRMPTGRRSRKSRGFKDAAGLRWPSHAGVDRTPRASRSHRMRRGWRASPPPRLPEVDTFRFGTAGEVDALLFLGDRLGRADLCRAAERLASASLARAASRGWRLLPGIEEEATL